MHPQEKKGQARQKDVSACVLALAMLNSFCRLPELASEQDQLKKVPLLLKAGLGLSLRNDLRYSLSFRFCVCLKPFLGAASYVERDGAHATYVPMLFLPRMLGTSDGHTASSVRMLVFATFSSCMRVPDTHTLFRATASTRRYPSSF